MNETTLPITELKETFQEAITTGPVVVVALTVASTGFRPQDLRFLDAPPDFAVERAQTALQSWGVLSEDGMLTAEGAKICALKLVTLRWQRGIRQPTLSTVLLPRWNNWKVQVDIRGQLRTVRPAS